MKIKRKNKIGFLETCAASDLAFLLIIYFLVIAGFNVNKGFLMNLPAKDSTRMILREELLRFDMNENGEIIHSEEVLDIRKARSIIYTAQKENPNIAVILTIDKHARWQNVVYFVELAQNLNVEAFSFSMKKEEQ
ncbi:MAG: biopolymer transporter ExbD [Treponema sp.]|nr:biopolymer transporter ExbD [Treponema sp.]MCL2252058.1 biopolymer transporter ExbD [Treponema sp.]